MEVPEGSSPHALIPKGGKASDLWTDVALILHQADVTEEELEKLRNCEGQKKCFSVPSSRHSPVARQALNSYIMAYGEVTGELFRGQPLRTLGETDFFMSVYRDIPLVGYSMEYWTPETIHTLFDLKPVIGEQIRGVLHDLPSDKLNGITECIERQSDFIFYELAFEAEARWVAYDRIPALLMAVAALEGVHGAFVTHMLGSRLPKDADRLAEQFIKELGMSFCNEVIPHLLMSEDDRPPAELIKKVSLALGYRNEIMHALRNKQGTYKIKTRTSNQIGEAYASVMQMYDYYRIAFEKLPRPPRKLTIRRSRFYTPSRQRPDEAPVLRD
ncbi:MAG: hypothetical protein ACLQBD_26105 [Syntrophobacteraceae bacterium]